MADISGANPAFGPLDPSHVSLSRPIGFNPGETASRISADDPYLVDYLLGWFGLADPQPWGAAMSFALEVAHGYGLIKGESDTTATPLGLAVADILAQSTGEQP